MMIAFINGVAVVMILEACGVTGKRWWLLCIAFNIILVSLQQR